MSKIVLLTDGSSPVPGFEYAVDKLMTDVRSVGLGISMCIGDEDEFTF